ncbi:MAG: N-acyl homoserine lactonase family protein [Candidatus Dormibacteraeota bacterium]|nr:N-acyl homoserine lactonase family protein [Candidatus Dormibacteraeota bacterium]MBO0706301.1 N-acyl homoserine lactonase family protein [Candidatus Dormibacteraeota bacterium]MBO0761131.1 N-acyl homoserine lactonase family protein [Candidatus Dormibacteraeota bacterium]
MSNRIFAVRYAHRATAMRSDNFYGPSDPHDGPMPMDYFIWAIAGDDGVVVVDTGFLPEVGDRRGRTTTADASQVLTAVGAAPQDVRDVVLTHFHYDHAGGLSLFPNARFWVQQQEMAFWTGPYAARPAIKHSIEPADIVELVRCNYDGRLRFLDGDGAMAPGVTLHRVGGHAPGLQVARVETGDGVVLLASDATHYYENLQTDRPFGVVHSLPDMYAAFDRLCALVPSPADIVPGHDPLVRERYAAVSPDLEGYAIEIRPNRS